MININLIQKAKVLLNGVAIKSPLEYVSRISDELSNKVYLKREDLQIVRSYKIRGAFTKISFLIQKGFKKGFVCSSAGNHAQGFAYACFKNKVKGFIFMPVSTPKQKVDRVAYFGKEFVEIKLVGDSYDETQTEALNFCQKNKLKFVHPFDDEEIIAGQGTIGLELIEDLSANIDYIFAPIGGGGLISGIASVIKQIDSRIKIIGVEPKGADSMYQSLKKNKLVELKTLDKFVDGTAVKKPGQLCFNIIKQSVDEVVVVDEGAVAEKVLDLYQNEGIITEPAGALALTGAYKYIKYNNIQNKTIVCIISGGNNDLLRYPEIMERALIYQGRKKYFIIEFYQKPGQLRRFLNEVLGENDDIVLFEYLKKNNKEKGPALVGLEFATKKDADQIYNKLKKAGFSFKEVHPGDDNFYLLV
ncbi:MAG: L-threonine dehydratase [Patescibacteria group bacterium]|nr:MAG: L-threonine dehydratase [Patescibacteria group bacterium]GIW63143.1 MAG: L-threonine dehydratase [Patescibacteria group bacterium]GIW63165.1 MAG: L-threonine dehydratase [Patescibacteria group bacterium]